jgi:hypothetical protein
MLKRRLQVNAVQTSGCESTSSYLLRLVWDRDRLNIFVKLMLQKPGHNVKIFSKYLTHFT